MGEPARDASDGLVQLGDLRALVGPRSLSVLAAPCGLTCPVRDIVIYDPRSEVPTPPAALLLAVGVDVQGHDARVALEDARAREATAVVFREKEECPPELIDQARRLGLAVLGMPAPSSWSELFAELRAAFVSAAGEDTSTDTLGAPIGDLFALADAIAALVGGPVTIEDPHSVVLAYSTTPEPIDEPRRQTILRRHSPAAWSKRLRDAGVFRRLWAGEVVRYEAPDVEGVAPRLAVGVRAGTEILGSIWVAETTTPLGAEAVDALRRSAHVAALHLLHQRAAADLARVVRGEHLRSLLEGRGPVESVAAELGIDPQSEFELLAFTLATEDPDALEAARDVAATLIPLHFEFVRQCSASVVIGDVIYALFPDKHEPSAQPLETAATEVVERLEHLLPVRVTVAVGSRADLYALSESRRMVDTTLRALEPMPHIRVARTVDLRNQVLLLEIGEILKRWPELFDEKVEVLAAYDESRGTEYVRTLRAYLDAFGDVALAADCLGVHPNTFRYRLHRILELADLDLDDPDERLAVEIGLRFR